MQGSNFKAEFLSGMHAQGASIIASLGIAFYALFIGLLVPNITKNFRLGLLIVLTAICNTVLSQFMPAYWQQ